MYDLSNFGQRLQILRKAKGMTQEDLAHRVGVSGQAVSKWETNQTYPEIVLIPDLAQILGTNVAHLFGEQLIPPSFVEFPTVYQGLPLVNSIGQTACYSNKAVLSKDDSGVKFTDGSTAELTTRLAVNLGQGSILFVGHEDIGPDIPIPSVSSKDFEFGHCHSIHVTVSNCSCKIALSPDKKTRVYAKGSPKFLNLLGVKFYTDNDGGTLNIEPLPADDTPDLYDCNNELLVELPFRDFTSGGSVREGGHMFVSVSNGGSVFSEIPLFNTGGLYINGSGTITAKDFTTSCVVSITGSGDVSGNSTAAFNVQIVGSGNVAWGKAEKVGIGITGSGGVSLGCAGWLNALVTGPGSINVGEANDVTGNIFVKVAGTGSIEFGGGACQKFTAEIAGGGSIPADKLTANKAHVVIHDSGSVAIGRVEEGSTEQVKKKGTITIHNRGKG